VGDNVKRLAEIKINYFHCFPLVQISSNFIVVVNRVGQSLFTLGKSMLNGPNHLILLRVHRNLFQKDLLHDFVRLICH